MPRRPHELGQGHAPSTARAEVESAKAERGGLGAGGEAGFGGEALKEIPVEDIRIESRFRRDYGDIAALAKSIEAIGLLQAIGVDPNNRLLFGERRIKAYQYLGRETIPARVISVDSILLAEHDENELRKDFTPSERVAIGQAIERELGERRGNPNFGKQTIVENFPQLEPGKKTRDIAAEKAGFGNANTYRQAKTVVEHGAPALVEAMDKGEASVSAAADLASLPQEEQTEVVAKGEKEILAKAKEIRAEKTARRRRERMDNLASIAKGNDPLPADRKYPVIYADPPWRYEHSESESRAIENQYPTLSLPEICALPVASICTDDAILFLWTTSPKLAESMQVIESWGFNYRTCAVWDKQNIGMGYYFRQQHELLLVATRGNIPAPEPSNRPASIVSEARTRHSAKPEHFREIIEAMYPALPRIELFCRNPKEGWSSWGNQAVAA